MPNHLENARLIAILGDYAKVRQQGSVKKLIKLVDKFDEALDLADHDTRIWANKQKKVIDTAIEADAFRLFAENVSALSEFNHSFNLGAKMARDGEVALIFPSAAASLGQIAGLLEELKGAAETIKNRFSESGGNIRDILGAVEIGDFTSLIDKLEAVQKDADSVKNTLAGFKDEVKNP